jgi:hypothetical protein
MYHKTRICPTCGKEIQYNTESGYYQARTRNSDCVDCRNKKRFGEGNSFYGKKHTKETKAKISAVDKGYTQTDEFRRKTIEGMGDKLGNVGGDPYTFWLEKYGKEEADKRLVVVAKKKSIANSGINNPMYGKPSPQRSGNGWKGWYDGIFFRSIRELMFRIETEEQKKSFCTGESRKTVIQYIDPLGQTRNYFPDFVVEEKHIVEVKPKRLWNTPTITAKRLAAEEWCKQRNMDYSLYDPKIDVDKIKRLWESNRIKWVKGYEQKFLEFLKK